MDERKESEFFEKSLEIKKKLRKKMAGKPQPVQILMNRTLNSGLMILKDLQDIPFEKLSFDLYFFCKDVSIKSFTREFEAQLELAAIDGEKFLAQLHNFYTKISKKIIKENLFQDFFEFASLCSRMRMERMASGGENKVITSYLNILFETMEYLRPSKFDFSKRVVGLSTYSEVLVADDFCPYYDIASLEVEENVEKHFAPSFITRTFAKYGIHVSDPQDLISIGNQDRIISSSSFALLPFINEYTFDILPTKFPASEDVRMSSLESILKPDRLKEILKTRKRTLPTNGVEVKFPNTAFLRNLILKEILYRDRIYLLYKIDSEDGDYSGFYDTKEGFFYSILSDSSIGESATDILASFVLYIYGCYVLDMDSVRLDRIPYIFSFSHSQIVAEGYQKGGKLKNVYRVEHPGSRKDDERYKKEEKHISGFIRKLPAGKSASEEAKQYAEKLGYDLSPNETFVRPFIRAVYKLEDVRTKSDAGRKEESS